MNNLTQLLNLGGQRFIEFALPMLIQSTVLILILLAAGPVHANPLAPLNDEFDNPVTLTEWSRLHQTEGWHADQLENWDIDTTQSGRMVLIPHTSTWYQDWKAALVYKNVTGDFVVTARISDRS